MGEGYCDLGMKVARPGAPNADTNNDPEPDQADHWPGLASAGVIDSRIETYRAAGGSFGQ